MLVCLEFVITRDLIDMFARAHPSFHVIVLGFDASGQEDVNNNIIAWPAVFDVD